jgi:acyl carrier protein
MTKNKQLTQTTDNSIKNIVIDLLLTNTMDNRYSPRNLPLTTPLGPDGLNISSLSLLHIFVKLENILGLTFDDASVAKASFVTVGEFVTFVDSAVSYFMTGSDS